MDISVALGGGGIRGVAHLGVLRALEKEGFRIRAAAGTSAGGVAAAVYAVGWKPEEMIDRFGTVDQSSLYSFGGGKAVLGNQGVRDMLSMFFEDESFADLEIPCALSTVDVDSMEVVALREGRVMDAVLATIAIPSVFPPQDREGACLVDGGVLDVVPVETARSLAPDLPVVAVSLTPPRERWKDLKTMDQVITTPVLRSLARTDVGRAFEISIRSIEMMNHWLALSRLEVENPEVVITPDITGIGMLETVDVEETAALGDQAVQEAMPALRALWK
jgi:NTE family protein